MSRTFMHYCRFECTAEALEEIVNDMRGQSLHEVDFNSMSKNEKIGYDKMIEMCKKILKLDEDLNSNNGD